MRDVERVNWHADLLNVVDEPMILSLLRYDMAADRQIDPDGELVSSYLLGSKLHAPIIDLDFPHHYVPSTNGGHGHLYIDTPMSQAKMMFLLWALRVTGVIEQGNFWWSLRRGGTFVRRPGIAKTEAEDTHYTYGMFFKLRKHSRGTS